jgi:hypothetical protein
MNNCDFEEIIVFKYFEIENGVLGLDRDCYLSIVKLLDSSTLRKVWINIFVHFFLWQYIGISEESFERMKHIHFVIYRLKSIIIIILLSFFFSDGSLPLSRLTIPNPHGKFKLEGRKITFEGIYNRRSLILKEGISDGILEVFVLC